MTKRIVLFFFLFCFLPGGSGLLSAAPLEKPYDHSLWDSFLKKFVNEEGEVNFEGVKKDPALLTQYLEQIGQVNEFQMAEDWPREEQIAFWINAYHAAAISAILKNYPVKSVQDIPSFWQAHFLYLRESYGLDDIRNQLLIGKFHDEKIHFALSSFAKAGPVLIREAYTGLKLEGLLYKAAKRFVNDAGRNKISVNEKNIFLSKLFKWYARDFGFNFGNMGEKEQGRLSRQEFAVLSFLAFYLEDAEKSRFLEEGNYKIKHLPFDWALTDWKSAQAAS